MSSLKRFIFLMKNEPPNKKKKKHSRAWIIDESKCLSNDEVKKLRDFCQHLKIAAIKKKKFSPIRNWFMTELGLNAGLRVNEMAFLKHGNLFLHEDKSSISLKGKGNKERALWINSKFKKKCCAYIAYKKRFGYATDADSYLLNNLAGNKISKRALQKFFKQIAKKAELLEHYSIHCLRHTYATFLLKASNYNYRFVQEQLGHSSIKTTQVYAGIIESDGRNALEKVYE
jgi:integrase/recombinase XerC